MTAPRYSIVIPIHNEEGNLEPLFHELDAVITALKAPCEVIAVDDHSSDGSRDILAVLKERYQWLRLIFFAANQGQSAAFDAGFRHASGEAVITMDADLQNDPADIPLLLEHYPAYDVVVGCRARRNDSLVKKVSSRVGNGVRNLLTGESITDTGCSLKVFRRDMVTRVAMFNGMHRFLPTLCRMYGATIKEVPVSHRPRVSGVSHYGIRNPALRGLLDTLAVCWMQSRALTYTTERVDE